MANPNFNGKTTAEEVANTYSKEIQGKTFFITGISPSSLGQALALAIAPHKPHLLILASRTSANLTSSISTLSSQYPNCATLPLHLDLSSQSTVREAAAIIISNTNIEKIDVLVNNAGIMATPWEKSVDGIEIQFATNHVGGWLLGNLLVRGGKIGDGGRIVNVGSAGHRFSGIRFEDWNFRDGKEYEPMAAYGQSKTANMLTAVSWASKLKNRGITAFSVHPGTVRTSIGRSVTKEQLDKMGITVDENGEFKSSGGIVIDFISHSQGAASILVAAIDPNIKDRSGAYLAECRVDHGSPIVAEALDEGNAERLWELTEHLVGEKFEL